MPIYPIRQQEILSQYEQTVLEAPKTSRTERAALESVTDFSAKEIDVRDGTSTPFVPIDAGNPLTVEIRAVYTGKHPKKKGLRKRNDFLMTSSMKSISQIAGQPKALNMLIENINKNQYIQNVSPSQQGTPLVYYSSALVEPNTTIEFEFGFDEFDESVFSSIANLFGEAAKLPIFLPQAGYLLAGEQLMKTGGKLASLLFDKGSVFKGSDSIELLRAGAPKSQAGFYLMTDNRLPIDVQRSFALDSKTLTMVEKANPAKPYMGDIPYVIFSLDGRNMDEYYKNFEPQAASADLLSRFYKDGNNWDVGIDVLIEGMTLVNDMKFRDKAQDMVDALGKSGITDEQKAALLKRLDSYNANIQTDNLKLPKPG